LKGEPDRRDSALELRYINVLYNLIGRIGLPFWRSRLLKRELDMKATHVGLIALAGMIAFVDQSPAQSSQPEEIYIVRSVRESRVAPTEFCTKEKTGFSAATEDQFSLRSTATGPGGRITDTNVQTTGDIHACFSSSSDSPFSFYGEGHLSGVPFKGLGDCQLLKRNLPEPGISTFRCWLDLSDLPAQYAGGVLTTNTLGSSKMIGLETVPEGYTQVSIATVRLWKKR
jgi:hypothetical protein